VKNKPFWEACMLTFDEKLAVLESFSELERKDVSLGRVNFHFKKSEYDKKIVVYHLHPNGNGFIYAGLLKGYPTDEKGFVNIRDYSADDIRALLEQSIASLSAKTPQNAARTDKKQESCWIGTGDQTLMLKFEDDMWYIYAGNNLEMAFEAYDEAAEYLQEEGFSLKQMA
jgi:hypothetical protein